MDLEFVNDPEDGLVAIDRETGEQQPLPMKEIDVQKTHSESINTEEQAGNHSVLLDSETKLENLDSNLSQGDVALVSQPDTPYRTTSWLDVDTSNVTILFESTHAKNGERIVKIADGANVGGLRIGHNSTVSNVTVRAMGYHGNPNNQDSTVKRLHGCIVEDATNVWIDGFDSTRASPYHEHNSGGSQVTVRHEASLVAITNCRLDDQGDRGIQVGGTRILIYGNAIKDGYDRCISFDYEDDRDTTFYGAKDAVVANNRINGNSNGSAIKGSQSDGRADPGSYSIFGNVIISPDNSAIDCRFQDNAIVANVVQGGGSTDAAITADVTDSNTVIAANVVKNHTGAAAYRVNREGVCIGNNTVGQSGDGIQCQPDTLVAGNRVESPSGIGVLVQQGSASVLSNHLIEAGEQSVEVTESGYSESHATLLEANKIVNGNQNGNGVAEIRVDMPDVTVNGNHLTVNGDVGIRETANATACVYTSNVGEGVTNPANMWDLNSPRTLDGNTPRPVFDAAPGSAITGTTVLASATWDPDGDGSGEEVVYDGSQWNESTPMPNL